MKMICEVPDEVIKCIKDGTWCGSSVAEKMIANGIPLSSSEEPCEDCISRQAVLDSIHANCVYENEYNLTAKHIEDAVKQLPPVSPQKPKSEWQQDHEILKAYSDGASVVLDKIREEIDEEYDKVHPYDISCAEGLEMALNIIDKFMAESEEKNEVSVSDKSNP